MAKMKRTKRSKLITNKPRVTDQNSGPQQLYEDRKLGHPDLKDAITKDLKRVRKQVGKKLDNRLLNRKKRESKSIK
jgi:hypothetical protein